MKVITRVVKVYAKHICIRRDIKDEGLQSRLLFGGLRSLYRQMANKGWIILSYDWRDIDDTGWCIPDIDWREYVIKACVIYAGKRKAQNACFRRLLRRGHGGDIIKYGAMK